MAGLPRNPRDGDIVELVPGLRFVYNGQLRSWMRHEVFSPPAATAVTPGLMTAVDFTKISRLVIPPPQSSLSVAGIRGGTDVVFDTGIITLASDDLLLTISARPQLVAPGVAMQINGKLHQLTHIFDFRVNVDVLAVEMARRGKLVVRAPTGPDGQQGPRGKPGRDNLTYGTQGPVGDRGANAMRDLTLAVDPISYNSTERRAISDIGVREVSQTENYLVVTRANVGNPAACPDTIRLGSDIHSNWVVCLPEKPVDDFATRENCLACSHRLYYLDLGALIQIIEEEADRELLRLKASLERIVNFWITTMSGVFDQQKGSLCCALEYCQSRKRNADVRKYIETSRIEAAKTQTITGAEYDQSTGNYVMTSLGHRVVIDGSPLTSGRSRVTKFNMSPVCGATALSGNANAVLNTADVSGGGGCIPGVAVINGETVKFDECPPGFVPKRLWRDRYHGVPYTKDSKLAAEYSIPQRGRFAGGATQYSYGDTSLLSVDAKRSSLAATSSMLRVRVDGTAEQIADVTVIVENKRSGERYIAGATDASGTLVFRNLSSSENYRVRVQKDGLLFSPPSWTDLPLNPTTVTEVTTSASSSTLTALASDAALVKCGNGECALNVLIEAASDHERVDVEVRIYNYLDGVFLCGGTASPTGHIRFTGIGIGRYIVKATKNPTELHTYTITPDCSPTQSQPPFNLGPLRQCPSVVYSAPGQEAEVTFVVSSLYMIASIPLARQSRSADSGKRSEIVSPKDPRYLALTGATIKAKDERAAPIEIQLFLPENRSFVQLAYVTAPGINPAEALSKPGGPRRTRLGSGCVLRYNDLLGPGTYTLCLSGGEHGLPPFRMLLASRNCQFLNGQGPGWDDAFIKSDFKNRDGKVFSGNAVIDCEAGPAAGENWWLQVEIEELEPLPEPYSRKCGAVGPRSSRLDQRLCRELIEGSGSPELRENSKGTSGRYQDWTTSTCEEHLLPDAVEVLLDGELATESGIVLCRTGEGRYTGGINFPTKSVQILLEQAEPKPRTNNPTHLLPTEIQPSNDMSGGKNEFNCTILSWKTQDCIGQVERYATATVQFECSQFTGNGNWKLPQGDVGFTVRGIRNELDLVAEAGELLLEIRGDNDHLQKRATAELPRGNYVVELLGCCLRIGEQYVGHIEVEFHGPAGVQTKRFPNLGAATNESIAKQTYQGLTQNIQHSGGIVAAQLVAPVWQAASGSVLVRFTAMGTKSLAKPQALHAERHCEMHVDFARVLAEEWSARSCDGCVIALAGQDYIIVRPKKTKSKVGCLSAFPLAAYAWPTLDGETFLDVPAEGMVGFKRIEELENLALDQIKQDMMKQQAGDPSSVSAILFPVIG